MAKKKKLLYVLSSIFLLPAAGVLIAAQIEFSSPKLAKMAASAVSEATGMPAHIGSLSIKLAGKAQASDIRIGEKGKKFLSADSITCKAKPLKLLVKKLSLYAELKEGEISSGEKNLKVDSVEMNISSEGKNKPIKIDVKGKAFHNAVNFSINGHLQPRNKSSINLDVSLDTELKNIERIASELDLKIPPFSGSGESKISMSIKGSPDRLNIAATADLTKNELAFKDLFRKEKNFPIKLEVNSTYEGSNANLTNARLKVGSGTIHLNGKIKEKGELQINAKTDAIDIGALAKCIPATGKHQLSGKAAFDLNISKKADTFPAISGGLKIEQWRIDTFQGQLLECTLKPRDKGIEIDEIEAGIGDGKLIGSGTVNIDGKFHFNIKGENLDMQKFLTIKKNKETALEMTGRADFTANLSSTEKGPQGLNGSGQISIQNGKIVTFQWIKDLLALINLPELMPLNYENINGAFKITRGIINLQTLRLEGKDALFYVKRGIIDLVKNEKEITADLALPPHLVKRERSKFKEFDKFFSVDSDGYAHLTAVWDGPLSETSPNITASLISTFGKKLLEKLLE